MHKLLLIMTTLSLALLQEPAFAEGEKKLSISKEAKERKDYFCKGGFKKDRGLTNDVKQLFTRNAANLKKFCTPSTFHCTNSQSLFGRNKGVCEDANLCKEPYLRMACRIACFEMRTPDEKTNFIRSKLDGCNKEPPAPQAAPIAPVQPPVVFDETPGFQSQGQVKAQKIALPSSRARIPTPPSEPIMEEPVSEPAVKPSQMSTEMDLAPLPPPPAPGIMVERQPGNRPTAAELEAQEIAKLLEEKLAEIIEERNSQAVPESEKHRGADSMTNRPASIFAEQQAPSIDNSGNDEGVD